MTETSKPSEHLGRGRNALEFWESTVVKKPASLLEPLTIKAFPQVFVPIISFDTTLGTFTMPRMLPSTVERRRTALMAGLDKLRLLWQQPQADNYNRSWRPKLYAHLTKIARENPQHVPKTIVEVVQSLPEPHRHVHIHGDATLANLIHNDLDEWFWIDPLQREFIPGDPHVDLGKLFQSCLGYESVLLGHDPPSVDRELCKQLARHANLNLNFGMKWLTVHIARLIPYQEERVKKHYADILKLMNL